MVLRLTQKCHKEQQGREEAEQLRVLLTQLEQSLLQLQKDKEALRCGPQRGERWERAGAHFFTGTRLRPVTSFLS